MKKNGDRAPLLGMILFFSGGGICRVSLLEEKFEPQQSGMSIINDVRSMMLLLFLFGLHDEMVIFLLVLLSEHKMECLFTTMELSYEHLTLQAVNRYWSGS